jgi:hypothetical protein
MTRKTGGRKSWAEKRRDQRAGEVKPCPNGFADIKAGEIMLLPSVSDLEAYVRRVRKGRSTGLSEMRAGLAQAHGAQKSCPVVTGISLRILAEAVGEELEAGAPPDKLTPVWRAMPPEAGVWKKLENGKAAMLALRRSEGLPVPGEAAPARR